MCGDLCRKASKRGDGKVGKKTYGTCSMALDMGHDSLTSADGLKQWNCGPDCRKWPSDKVRPSHHLGPLQQPLGGFVRPKTVKPFHRRNLICVAVIG